MIINTEEYEKQKKKEQLDAFFNAYTYKYTFYRASITGHNTKANNFEDNLMKLRNGKKILDDLSNDFNKSHIEELIYYIDDLKKENNMAYSDVCDYINCQGIPYIEKLIKKLKKGV